MTCTEGWYFEASTETCDPCPIAHYCVNSDKIACIAGEFVDF